MISHRAGLERQLRLLPALPALICDSETFLDDSVGDDQLWLGGYKLASRRDRSDGREGGGVLCFVADRYATQVALCEHSDAHERSWHTIHSDIGPVLCGIWYRPPCHGEVASITACDEEWRRLSGNFVATILVGDLNVHHTRWLRHSSSVSVEGTSLYRFCMASGFKQFVKHPTRGENLLDLIISDLDRCKVEILPQISDHNMVLATFDLGVPESEVIARTVFQYAKADWEQLRCDMAAFDWTLMDQVQVDAAERFFHDNVLAMLERHVPRREVRERKSAHQWVNDRCLAAIRDKNEGVDGDFASRAVRCSELIFEEYLSYVQRMRDKLLRERRGSKQWCRIADEIMDKTAN